MPDPDDLTALAAALALEGIAPEVRARVFNRLTHGEPTPADHLCTRVEQARIVASVSLGVGSQTGEVIGQQMAALVRDMWDSAGQFSRLWLEWNVQAPPAGLPATVMRLAAQIDPPTPDPGPEPETDRALLGSGRDELPRGSG